MYRKTNFCHDKSKREQTMGNAVDKTFREWKRKKQGEKAYWKEEMARIKKYRCYQ